LRVSVMGSSRVTVRDRWPASGRARLPYRCRDRGRVAIGSPIGADPSTRLPMNGLLQWIGWSPPRKETPDAPVRLPVPGLR